MTCHQDRRIPILECDDEPWRDVGGGGEVALAPSQKAARLAALVGGHGGSLPLHNEPAEQTASPLIGPCRPTSLRTNRRTPGRERAGARWPPSYRQINPI